MDYTCLNHKRKQIPMAKVFFDSIKENKLRLRFIELSEWLRGHQEFVDEWGSEVDKIAFKKT